MYYGCDNVLYHNRLLYILYIDYFVILINYTVKKVLDFILIYKLLYLSYKIVNSRLVVILYQLNMLYKLLISVYLCCFYLFTNTVRFQLQNIKVSK